MSDASLVVQAIVAPDVVTPDEPTPLIVGAVVSGAAAVVNVKLPEVARLPAASRDLTR